MSNLIHNDLLYLFINVPPFYRILRVVILLTHMHMEQKRSFSAYYDLNSIIWDSIRILSFEQSFEQQYGME